MRLIFAYGWNDWSLRITAPWASCLGLADMSDVAVLIRLRHACARLGSLLERWFHERGIDTTIRHRFRLAVTDSTTIHASAPKRIKCNNDIQALKFAFEQGWTSKPVGDGKGNGLYLLGQIVSSERNHRITVISGKAVMILKESRKQKRTWI
ncbi:MAG: hypothetical protein C7B45_03745 [Sulfobacillus acidophilus]|uniref:Uncharacterized protein n=1 Tax=Sulfobacillus acidophilus TaxID=53633 RepID=A0A2T2WLV4_9FIRM|nr:MAG: hypothetical protein C7B45_03745 [Sulfobacillus acidophilus]